MMSHCQFCDAQYQYNPTSKCPSCNLEEEIEDSFGVDDDSEELESPFDRDLPHGVGFTDETNDYAAKCADEMLLEMNKTIKEELSDEVVSAIRHYLKMAFMNGEMHAYRDISTIVGV